MHPAPELPGFELARRGGIVQKAKLARVAVELVLEPSGRKPEGEGKTAGEPPGKVFDGQEVSPHGRLEGRQRIRPQVRREVRIGELSE